MLRPCSPAHVCNMSVSGGSVIKGAYHKQLLKCHFRIFLKDLLNPPIFQEFVYVIWLNLREKNPTYGQFLALLNVCDLEVPILYHDSMYIPWVYGWNMSPCLYHESMAIPLVHVHTMSPCIYHEFMYILWVHVYTMCHVQWFHVYTMIPCLYHKGPRLEKAT